MSHALTYGETPTSDDKLWATIAHVSPFVSTFIGPLLVLLLYKDNAPYVKYHAVQSLAYQILALIIGVFGGSIIAVVGTFTCGLGYVLYLLLLPLPLVPLWGAYLAWNGRWDGFPGLSSFGR